MSRTKSKQRHVIAPNVPALAPIPAVASSLPPTPDQVPAPPPTRLIEKHSLIRRKALAIVAMRREGYTTDEIAAELQIKPKSVKQYVYMAHRSGYLVKNGQSVLVDPTERVEFELADKAVRNLSAALDDSVITTAEGEIKPVSKRMYEATMAVAQGAIFKKFDPAAAAPVAPGMQVLQVKIEMPAAGEMKVRDGTIGGVGSYIEGEAIGDKDQRD